MRRKLKAGLPQLASIILTQGRQSSCSSLLLYSMSSSLTVCTHRLVEVAKHAGRRLLSEPSCLGNGHQSPVASVQRQQRFASSGFFVLSGCHRNEMPGWDSPARRRAGWIPVVKQRTQTPAKGISCQRVLLRQLIGHRVPIATVDSGPESEPTLSTGTRTVEGTRRFACVLYYADPIPPNRNHQRALGTFKPRDADAFRQHRWRRYHQDNHSNDHVRTLNHGLHKMEFRLSTVDNSRRRHSSSRRGRVPGYDNYSE